MIAEIYSVLRTKKGEVFIDSDRQGWVVCYIKLDNAVVFRVKRRTKNENQDLTKPVVTVKAA